jgi:hypothetical protein
MNIELQMLPPDHHVPPGLPAEREVILQCYRGRKGDVQFIIAWGIATVTDGGELKATEVATATFDRARDEAKRLDPHAEATAKLVLVTQSKKCLEQSASGNG